MKKSNFTATVLLLGTSLGTSMIPGVALADQAACLSQKGNANWRIAHINSMFADGGKCASLNDDSKAAVRSDTSAKALENFRKIKSDWIEDFNGENPYALKSDLDDIRAKTDALLRAPAATSPISAATRAKAQALIVRIDNLYRAVDRMRPNGGTTPDNVTAIDNAFDALDGACPNDHTGVHCPGFGPGAVTSLFSSIQAESTKDSNPLLSSLFTKLGALNPSESRAEFDNIHAILDCRLSNDALPGLRAQVASSCPADPAVANPLNAFLQGMNLNLFRWDQLPGLTRVPASPAVDPSAVNANPNPAPVAPVAAPVQVPPPTDSGAAIVADPMDGGTPPGGVPCVGGGYADATTGRCPSSGGM